MAKVHEFDEKKVKAAIEAARSHHGERAEMLAASPDIAANEGVLHLAAECISVVVEDGKVCLKLPIINKNVCLPVPSWIPNGTAAEACLNICTIFGIPTGVCVSVSALGHQIVHQCFGKC